MGLFEFFRQDKDRIYDKGVRALKAGKFSNAIQHFSEVISIDNADAQAHYNLAMSYIAVKRYGDALGNLKEYIQLDPDADEDIKEYIVVLEKAASVDSAEADQILKTYVQQQKKDSSEAIVGHKTVHINDLLKMSDGLLFEKKFSECKTIKQFGKSMSAKIPLRFYSISGFQNLNPEDAFGFAIAFTSTGYAVAKASLNLLGYSTYFSVLREDVARKLRATHLESGIPIAYDLNLLKKGNPIPWGMIHQVLDVCIASNLSNFINRFPWAENSADAVMEHLVKEFVYVGYYIGLWENAEKHLTNRCS